MKVSPKLQLDINMYIRKLTLEPMTKALDRTETSTAFAHNCKSPEEVIPERHLRH